MKKLLLLHLFMLGCLIAIGQIKGTLLDADSIPGELVFHYNLPEIVVSSNYAFQLFKKSSENTFNRLKDKSISRGYLRYTKVANNDTLVLQDLDLDIKKQKLKSFDQGEKISVIKIQERSVDSVLNDNGGSLKKFICPPVNIMKWDLFSKSFNYYKVEDSETIRLFFINKKNTSDNIVHFEVIIQKEDSCLSFIGVTFSGVIKNKNGSKELNTKSFSFMKYGFADEISFLSETFDRVIVPDPKNKDTSIEMTLSYKTYNNGIHNLEPRPKGRTIKNNRFDSHSVKNKYYENFWINKSGIGKVDYDFSHLVNMKMED